MKADRELSRPERVLLDYVKRAKRLRKTVWLSEAIEELEMDPREAVRTARKLEERGLLKPKLRA